VGGARIHESEAKSKSGMSSDERPLGGKKKKEQNGKKRGFVLNGGEWEKTIGMALGVLNRKKRIRGKHRSCDQELEHSLGVPRAAYVPLRRLLESKHR